MNLLIEYQVLGQGLYQIIRCSPRSGEHKGGKPMEIVQCSTSGAGKDITISYSHICLHHRFQHNLSTTTDILSPARECHGHTSHRIFSHPSRVASGHPIPVAHCGSPSLRRPLRPLCKKNHRPWVRNLTFAANRHWPLPGYLFYGLSCPHGEEEKGCCCKPQPHSVHLLDYPTIHYLWAVRDVYCCWPHWVLLQTIPERDADILDSHHILLILIWVLSELSVGLFGE